MASKTIIVNGSTKINVDGLTPEQVKKVQAISTNGGAYGTKGAALAKTLQTQNAKTAANPTTKVPPTNLGIDSKTGGVDAPAAIGQLDAAQSADTTKTFNMQNPGEQTDASGNTQTITRDPITGQTSIAQKSGAGLTAANSQFVSALGNLNGNGRKTAQDATYNYMTRFDSTNKAQEMEAKKQELAERGIPIEYSNDPNNPSLWQKSMADIDRKYQGLTDQANNQAITAGNSAYATDVGAVQALGATVQGQTPNFTAYQGGQSNQAQNFQQALSSIAGFDAQKYATDLQYRIAKDAEATKRMAIAKSGSGSGAKTDTSDVIY